MGFDLGLAAAAYQGSKAETRRLRDDDFVKAQHDYAVANMEEATSRRAYRDNAASLADAKVTSEASLLPQETAVRSASLDAQEQIIPEQTKVQLGGLDATQHNQTLAKDMRGITDFTARNQAENAYAESEIKATELGNIADWSDEKKAQNALAIDASIAGRADKADALRNGVFASIYQASTTGKMQEHDIIARMNALNGSNLFPALKGRTVGDLEKVNRPDGAMMVVRDTDGKTIMEIPVAQMEAAHAAELTKSGNVIKLNDGQNAYRGDGKGGLIPLTDNKKSFNPNSGGARGAGGANATIDRVAASLQAEATASKKTLSQADAYRQASAMLKSNPGLWAQRMLANDFSYTGERDPEKRKEMEAEALETAKRLAGNPQAPAAPPAGLSAASPQTSAKIKAAVGL